MASDPNSISATTNPDYKPDGLAAYLSSLIKYQFTPTKPGPYTTTTKLLKLSKPSTSGSAGEPIVVKEVVFKDRFGRIGKVPATSMAKDLQYLCPVTIGTPGKVYNLNFDTGSSDLWLWSTELPPSTNFTGRHLYDRKKSRTFQLSPNSTWAVSYNDRSYVSGIVGTDVVDIGGLRVKGQSIELATNISDSFQRSFGDGLVGLAFDNINRVLPVPVPTFASNLISQRNAPVDKQVFTAYLTSYRDVKNPFGKSFYSFGRIIKRALAGQQINYVDSDNSQGFWQFPSATATVGDRQISRLDNTAVADTATTLALLEDVFVDYFYGLIPGAYYDSGVQGYVYPTNTTQDAIPAVKIAVGDIEYEIRKADLGYAEVGEGLTYGGIQSRGDLSFDVLGDTFLKSVYAIFDIGNSKFGVVPKVAGTNTSDPHPHHHHHHRIRPFSPSPSDQYSSKSPTVPRPKRHAPFTDPLPLARREAPPTNNLPLAPRQASSTSGAPSLLPRGFSPPNKSALAYGFLLLLTYFFSTRGSARLLIAGWLCLFFLS